MVNIAFQFHKGTIRTYLALDSSRASIDFNSIKVQLELNNGVVTMTENVNFNSIKVQLELDVI